MNNFSKGDYVHVPGGTNIFQFDLGGSVKMFRHISKPSALMFLGESGEYYKVFYTGEVYLINKKNVYNLGDDSE